MIAKSGLRRLIWYYTKISQKSDETVTNAIRNGYFKLFYYSQWQIQDFFGRGQGCHSHLGTSPMQALFGNYVKIKELAPVGEW